MVGDGFWGGLVGWVRGFGEERLSDAVGDLLEAAGGGFLLGGVGGVGGVA